MKAPDINLTLDDTMNLFLLVSHIAAAAVFFAEAYYACVLLLARCGSGIIVEGFTAMLLCGTAAFILRRRGLSAEAAGWFFPAALGCVILIAGCAEKFL